MAPLMVAPIKGEGKRRHHHIVGTTSARREGSQVPGPRPPLLAEGGLPGGGSGVASPSPDLLHAQSQSFLARRILKPSNKSAFRKRKHQQHKDSEVRADFLDRRWA